MVVIDWAMLGAGHLAWELVYFISGSCPRTGPPEAVYNEECRLLELYPLLVYYSITAVDETQNGSLSPLSLCLSVCLSVYLSVRLSVCLLSCSMILCLDLI